MDVSPDLPRLSTVIAGLSLVPTEVTSTVGTTPTVSSEAQGSATDVLVSTQVQGLRDGDDVADSTPTITMSVQLPDGAGSIVLDGIPSSPDASPTVRGLLAEHPLSCCFTSYRLEIAIAVDGRNSGMNVPFTESTDLMAIATVATRDPSTPTRVIMIFEPYNVRSSRAHVRRLREVLFVRPPVVQCVVEPTPPAEGSNDGDAKRQSGSSASATTASQPPPKEHEPSGREVAMAVALDANATGVALLMHLQEERERVTRAIRELQPWMPSIPLPPADLARLSQPPVPVDPEAEMRRLAGTDSLAAVSAASSGVRSGGGSGGGPASNTSIAPTVTPLVRCLISISGSGWNPPPAPRRMAGDLSYYRVETLEGSVLHVTGTPIGFFVNRTTDAGAFDPTPATTSYSSRTMWTLLHRASPAFRKAYQQLPATDSGTSVGVSRGASSCTSYVPLLPCLNAPGCSDGSGGAASPSALCTPAASYGVAAPPSGNFSYSKSPWLVPVAGTVGAMLPPPSTSGSDSRHGRNVAVVAPSLVTGTPQTHVAVRQTHEFDAARAEDDALATWGMDDRGALRDWNEEWQCVRTLDVGTDDDGSARVARARANAKVLTDFVDAATQGCIAIVGGHITPLNGAEDPRAHVWVFNGIFYSLALDAATKGKERRARAVARAAGGPHASLSPGPLDDVASLASPNHDLQGVRALQAADIEGLHTLATAVVSYAGHRLVAQSIIPGILQADTASHLVYGSSDNGASIASEPRMHALMQRAAAKLRIAERVVTPLGRSALPLDGETAIGHPNVSSSDRFAGDAKSAARFDVATPLCGPIECKGIRGSDGRLYCLDLVRMTPRDPVYYDARRSAAVISGVVDEEEILEGGGYTALLRPELLDAFDVYRATAEGSAWLASRVAGDALTSATSEMASVRSSMVGGTGAPLARDEARSVSSTDQDDAQRLLAPLAFNVNVFTRFASLCLPPEIVAADEAALRLVSTFLVERVLPAVLLDIRRPSGSLSAVPGDGITLTKLLHARGVNVRCLGRLAAMAAARDNAGTIAPFVLEMLETEIVARVARRILDALLRDIPACRDAPAITIATFLNALLGSPTLLATATESAANVVWPTLTAPAASTMVPSSSASLLPLLPGGNKRASAGGKLKRARGDAAVIAGVDVGGRTSPALAPPGTTPPTVGGIPMSVVATVVRTTGGLSIPVPRVTYPANDVAPVASAARCALEAEGFGQESLWADIAAGAQAHFGYASLQLWNVGQPSTAPAASSPSATSAEADSNDLIAGRRNKTALLRRLCQRCGLQIAARTYDYNTTAPFVPEDILGFAPIVKSSMPSSVLPEADTLIAIGRATAARGDLKSSFEYVSQAVSLNFNVAGGPLAPGMGDACGALASILWHVGDAGAAILQQARALALHTALSGGDSLDAAHAHVELGVYYAELGATSAAVRHLTAAVAIMSSAGSADHPELAGAYLRLGTALLDAHHLPGSIAALNEAVHRSRWDAQTAGAALSALGLAYSLLGKFKEALQCARSAFGVYRERGPEAAPLADDAERWMRAFTQRAVDLERAAIAFQSGSAAALLEHRATGEGNTTEPTGAVVGGHVPAREPRRGGKK